MKPSLPKGTRDFLPDQIIKRNHIFDTIKSVFQKFGFAPIETPAMESLQTLMGKYGDEGDQLLFKILNNGDFLSKADESALTARDSNKALPSLAKRGLRYDLTVPFARYVVMHQNDIKLPFKRYQIQPVWRADRPQKGRYQEFYQCDVDVVGSKSLMYEAELMAIFDEVFNKLNVPVEIQVNNRKILEGLAEAFGLKDQFMPMTILIDKIDKISPEKLKVQLLALGLADDRFEEFMDSLQIKSLADLEKVFGASPAGQYGIAELRTFHSYLDTLELKNEINLHVSLARGLTYYTGCIFEVKAKGVKMGSIASGGRYDNLTGVFGLKDVSGVGISFGAERIFDVMDELSLFPDSIGDQLELLFVALDDSAHIYAFEAIARLRAAGISADIYPEPVKMKKQMKYANDRKASFVAIAGDEEKANGVFTLKNMDTGDQESLSVDQLIQKFSADSF